MRLISPSDVPTYNFSVAPSAINDNPQYHYSIDIINALNTADRLLPLEVRRSAMENLKLSDSCQITISMQH